MRIDAHVHFTPPSLAADLPAFAEREPYWGWLLNPPQGKSIQGWADAERIIADMDAADFDQVVLVGEYYQRHESCVGRNSQALAILQRYPGRVLPLAVIQPKAPEAMDELKRCLDGGMVGVGELNPYAQGYSLRDPDFLRLVEACLTAAIPLNLHVSEEIGPYYLGKSTDRLADYYWLACQFPELKLVLAHWGGGLFLYEAMAAVRGQLKNVYYDTAASPLLYDTAQIFSAALAILDPRKILYGSDYPLRIYPRTMREPDMRPFPAAIAALALEPAILAQIMGENAAQVYGRASAISHQPSTVGAQRSPRSPQSLTFLPVSLLIQSYPQAEAVLARHGLDGRGCADWEPLGQAAAAHGLGPTKLAALLAELEEEIRGA